MHAFGRVHVGARFATVNRDRAIPEIQIDTDASRTGCWVENMEEEYETEILQLCEEIAVLEVEKETFEREVSMQYGQYDILGAIEEDDIRRQDISKLMENIEKLEKNLARQTRLNGITLTRCCVKTIEKSKIKLVQQHRLTGHCHLCSFEVEFEIIETQEDDSLMRKVMNLNIVVDGNECKDISSIVSRVEETKSLLLFFKTLKSFCENCEHRRKTFQHFKEKYPNMVTLPEGCQSELMLIQSPKLKGCSMCIFWDIDVTLEGEIRPKIDLLLKMPEEVLTIDYNIVANAPEYFQNLLRILGAEASIESVIKTVCV
ncbi:centromere protein P isoform X1 [Alosa sapidissima]|uniref:centromere protein P isoform X1 n=2 Tax=Alosa sapidissima TaxID=34773 RepID=UPI001C09D740|nr:centromere protein P isoform X1 [Alosa sapidissima]